MLNQTPNDPQQVRVVTSCRSRFFIFDQARELARHGLLHQLITDYPKYMPHRFDVPTSKVRPLIFSGILYHGLSKIRKYIPKFLRSSVDHWVHNRFSSRLVHLIPCDTQYFIGLSSFCLEALVECRNRKILCHVEHASLHQFDERNFVAAEAARWNVPLHTDFAPNWVVEKEDREFEVADFIHVPSSVVRDSLIHNGVSAKKIRVNSYGVNLESFCPGNKKDDVFRVLQVSKISVGKGVLTLLAAFSALDRPDSELCFAGAGLEISGLSETINRSKSNQVKFLPHVRHQESLKEYYNNASVFVLASVSDGFALVVAQAMACGLPVIVTENVGAKDLITDGENGFIVPVASPEKITDRLRFLYDNPKRCREMGVAARKTITKGNSWRDYGDRLANIIKAEMSQRKTPALKPNNSR